MILLRIVLICLIVYLLIRSFSQYGEENDSVDGDHGKTNKERINRKKISINVGDYIDFEEVDKENK
jgi:hypothetical protein